MARRNLPQPERFTVGDATQIFLGIVMVPLGIVIFGRTWVAGAPLAAILIGGAFIAFGVYRSLFAWGRIRWYMQSRGETRND